MDGADKMQKAGGMGMRTELFAEIILVVIGLDLACTFSAGFVVGPSAWPLPHPRLGC